MDELFYIPFSPQVNEVVTIDDENFHHIIRVMRKNIGDHLDLTNGTGKYFQCEITGITKKYLTTRILSVHDIKPPMTRSLHLYCGVLKNRDRFEWLTEKSGELGISSLTPIHTERTVKQSNNIDRLQKIAVSALKQSKNTYLLKINSITSLSDILKNAETLTAKYFLHEKKLEHSVSINSVKSSSRTDIHLFIGPEGGFSDSEVASFLKSGIQPVWLGEQRFRTETAVLVAASYLNQEFVSHG